MELGGKGERQEAREISCFTFQSLTPQGTLEGGARGTEAFVVTYLYDITKPAVKARVPECGNKSSVERLLGACE